MKIRYVTTANKSECCGCTACEAVCPVSAIALNKDSEGFVYPTIDSSKCVECGRCNQVCPIENKAARKKGLAAYAAVHKNEEILKHSSSGAVFSAVAGKVIGVGGIVFGVVINDNIVYHCTAETVEALAPMRGSKYVQSDMGKTVRDTARCIKAGRTVLFAGTPCQCAAVRNVIGDNEDKLITIDFVCHGVPSPDVFADYLQWLEKSKRENIRFLSFRAKLPDRIGIYESYCYASKIETNAAYDSPFLTGFMNGIIYRPSCYSCPYATKERASDITMCDYWGCERQHPELDPIRGISAVIISTENGMKWFDSASDCMTLISTKVDQIAAENGNLIHPTPKPPERDAFFADRVQLGFDELAKKYLTDKQAWKKRVIARVPRGVKRVIRAIKG